MSAPTHPPKTPPEPEQCAPSLGVTIACWLLKTYHRLISPLLGNRCRFAPTCSDYAQQALVRFGVIKGFWLTLRRLSRCQPWGGSGYDPVPERPDS